MINYLLSFVFGQRKKGERVKSSVTFNTTLPENQLSTNEWFRSIHQESYLIHYNKKRN